MCLNFLSKDKPETVHVNDIDDLLGEIELIDIREPYEFKGGSLDGAKNIPMGNLLSDPDRYLDKEKTYYIVCLSGARSYQTSTLLNKQGYKIVNVAGGVGSYVGTRIS